METYNGNHIKGQPWRHFMSNNDLSYYPAESNWLIELGAHKADNGYCIPYAVIHKQDDVLGRQFVHLIENRVITKESFMQQQQQQQ